MSKPAAIFVAAAMAVTAGCVAVIASYGLGLSLAQAMLCGAGALVVLALTQLAFSRSAPQDLGRLDDIDRLVNELQSRLETIEARLTTLDGAAAERARAATKPMVDEIAALGGLVTTIAKEVAGHDVELAKLKAASGRSGGAPAPFAAPRKAPDPSPAPQIAAPAMIRAPEAFDPADDFAAVSGPTGDLGARIDQALAADRIEPHLQPIVALPSRRATHYEALARLAEADGLLAAEHFLPEAIARGRVAEIDRRILLRCAPVAQRLAAKGGGAVFVNVASETLASADGRARLLSALDGRADVCRSIVLELPQAAFAGLGPDVFSMLDRLRGQGLRLSLDQADDLRFDPRELSHRGVRFVKVAADRLLNPESARGLAIHPADLAGLLVRQGVELVATGVEDERTVPELLDMEVRLSQGHLFGVPRPVRPAAPDAPAEPPAARPAAAGRLVPRAVGAR